MKVLQINSVSGIGSTGRIATDIHNMLIHQGHESYIAYGRDQPKSCENTIKIGTKFDNYTHAAKTRIFDKHGFGSRKATLKLIDKVKELNPDIIHLHNIHGYYLNIEFFFNYLKEANKPVVWTLHDCWSFTGHCSHFDYVGCEKWKLGCFNCILKKSYPSSVFFDNSRENYHKKKQLFTGIKNMTVVTPSKWLADLVKESFLNKYSVKVINNGIDLDIFKPTVSNFRENNNIKDKFIILGVTNIWGKSKGFNYFLELSNILPEDEVIVLVGLTEKQKENLPQNIIGITRTNNVIELAEIYTAADVFVNPTIEDNFPTTNLEAMACGTPVITFDTGGSSECVDKTCGIITENKDTESILSSTRIIKEIGKCKYSDDCKDKANKFYNKNDRFEQYIKLYKYILSAY